LKRFRREYDGTFELDTRFLKGINDNERNVDGLKEFMEDLNPDKYYIFDAKYKDQALDKDFVKMLKRKFDELPVETEYNV